jgi:hypothetical protein
MCKKSFFFLHCSNSEARLDKKEGRKEGLELRTLEIRWFVCSVSFFGVFRKITPNYIITPKGNSD